MAAYLMAVVSPVPNMGGGELLLEFADRGAVSVTFLAELGCEDVHDVVLLRGCGLCGDMAGGPGGLLGAELLDALPQFGAGAEEIEADPGGPVMAGRC